MADTSSETGMSSSAAETDASESGSSSGLGSTGTSGDSTGPAETSETTGAPSGLTHDFVGVQLERSPAAAEDPFVGTTEVRITMSYGSCFVDFYDANPNYAIEGIDGMLIFGSLDQGGEGWRDRLCDPMDAGQVSCTVTSFEQELDAAQLTVTFETTDELEGDFLKFGPLPLPQQIPDFTCDGPPTVHLTAQQVVGMNARGMPIWRGESADADAATPGQSAALIVRVAPE